MAEGVARWAHVVRASPENAQHVASAHSAENALRRKRNACIAAAHHAAHVVPGKEAGMMRAIPIVITDATARPI